MPDSGKNQFPETAALWPVFHRRLWSGVLLLNFLVAGLAAYFLYASRLLHIDHASKETRNIALLLEGEIAGTFDSIDLVLKNMTEELAGQNNPPADIDRELQRMQKRLPVLSGLRLVDAEGGVIAGLMPGELPGISIADRDYFIAHREQTRQHLIISQPVFSRMTRQWSVVFSRRIDGRGGRFSGIIAASLPLKYFAQRFETLKIGTNGSIGFRDEQLRLIIRYPEIPGGNGQIGSTKIATDFTEALARNASEGSYRAGVTTIDGIQRLHSYRLNNTYGFYINVGIAEEEYLSTWYGELYRSASFVAAFLLATFLLAFYLQNVWRRKELAIAGLQDSESRFRVIFEQAGVGVAEGDSNTGKFIRANQKYADIVGYSIEELNTLNFQTITYPQDLPVDLDKMALLKSGAIEQYSVEKRYVRKGGGIVWVSLTVSTIRSERSNQASNIVIVQDISERKRIEERLRVEEERFRSFVENVNDVLFVLTKEGHFQYLSPQWTEAFGYPIQECLGHPFAPFVHPDDVAACVAFLQKTFTTGEKQGGIEYRVRCADGRYLWYRANASLVKNPETSELMFIGIGHNITQIKLAEKELMVAKQQAESSNLAKSRFLAAASHDLRQPMQAISLFVDSLNRTQLSDDQRRITQYLEDSAQSLGDLLNVLLDISKLDAGAIDAKFAAIDVSTLMSRIQADFSTLAARKALQFKLYFPLGEMLIHTDSKLLLSLLGNLVSNAIKYTEQGGILVAFRRRGTQVLVQVWDTGIGIAPEHMDTIFEEFFQIENPERDRSKGLGLGLAIAERIAKLLETKLNCRSRPGKGSVFEFCLPLILNTENAPSNQITSQGATFTSKLAGRRVTLVEDNVMVGTATKLALESIGMVVTHYKTAEEALADSGIAQADFYITDLRLPGMDGMMFLDAVQQRSAKEVRAVVVTGDMAVSGNEMMRPKSWRVLFKPVELDTLLAAIEAHDSVH